MAKAVPNTTKCKVCNSAVHRIASKRWFACDRGHKLYLKKRRKP